MKLFTFTARSLGSELFSSPFFFCFDIRIMQNPIQAVHLTALYKQNDDLFDERQASIKKRNKSFNRQTYHSVFSPELPQPKTKLQICPVFLGVGIYAPENLQPWARHKWDTFWRNICKFFSALKAYIWICEVTTDWKPCLGPLQSEDLSFSDWLRFRG